MQLLHYSVCTRGLRVHYCVHATCVTQCLQCALRICALWLCVYRSRFMMWVFVFLIIPSASPCYRKVASTATPPLSWRRWSWSRAPFTRRRRGWPRTGLETTARIRSLWVTSSSAQADKSPRELSGDNSRASLHCLGLVWFIDSTLKDS